MHGNGDTYHAAERPGLISREKPSSGEWKNRYCRRCGAYIPRPDRYSFTVAAGLCYHLGQALHADCLQYYRRQQEDLVAQPRNILLETLHCDGRQVFGLSVQGKRLRLQQFPNKPEAIRWVFSQLRELHRFVGTGE